MQTGWKQLNGNWYYFQADGSLLRNGTTPDGYKVNQDGIWSLNPDKVEVQGSQEDPKKDSDKPVEKEEKSAEVNAKAGGKALIGNQVRDCHNARSKAIIEQLFAGNVNAYTIEKQGVRKLIYQAPWSENGEVHGLVELSIILPSAELPHYIRS